MLSMGVSFGCSPHGSGRGLAMSRSSGLVVGHSPGSFDDRHDRPSSWNNYGELAMWIGVTETQLAGCAIYRPPPLAAFPCLYWFCIHLVGPLLVANWASSFITFKYSYPSVYAKPVVSLQRSLQHTVILGEPPR